MFFKKETEGKVMDAVDNVNESIRNEETKVKPVEPADEWIWVEGYKGTDKDMQCRGYQYELGMQHDMPDDSKIEECETGFHLCRDLNDVFGYYNIGFGNRFFKVRALVRKSDYDRYGEAIDREPFTFFMGKSYYDKLVAKSIVFERELTPDEILKDHDNLDAWTDNYKILALKTTIDHARDEMRVIELTNMGYSETFARHVVVSKRYDIAKAVGSQPDLSMDMKCWLIFK